jgi:molecular chaperone DnaJ/curved DNA-binding protein
VDWEKYEKAGLNASPNSGGFSYNYTPGAGAGSAGPNAGFGDIFDSIFGTSKGAGSTNTRTRPGPTVNTRTSEFGFGRGSAGTSPRPQRGEDQEQQIEVTLEEAFQGSTRQLQVQASEICSTCSGTGLRNGQRCPVCSGRGLTMRSKRLEVRIPPGVDEGTRVKVPGEGAPGLAGGPRGDLLLKVHILPHPAFVRKGGDLHTTATIPLYTAVLGGEIIITSPKGSKFALTVPGETQNGKVFRLTGQGMPLLNSNTRGDMYVKVEVVLPSNLSDAEKDLFQQLKDMRS